MNEGNLIPLNQRSLEERREIARMGGIKSGETRRRRKEMKDRVIEVLKRNEYIDHIVIGHEIKKRYCGSCKYKQRANKERSGRL